MCKLNLVVKYYHNVTTHGVIGLDGTSYFLANPKSAEKTKTKQIRVKTSNFGRFFAVSLFQHGLCFTPDMSPG